jgi:hypothetical protein
MQAVDVADALSALTQNYAGVPDRCEQPTSACLRLSM